MKYQLFSPKSDDGPFLLLFKWIKNMLETESSNGVSCVLSLILDDSVAKPIV